jgi:hypothetical protein
VVEQCEALSSNPSATQKRNPKTNWKSVYYHHCTRSLWSAVPLAGLSSTHSPQAHEPQKHVFMN